MNTWSTLAISVILLSSACRSDAATVDPSRAQQGSAGEGSCGEPPERAGARSGRLLLDVDEVAAGEDVVFRWDVSDSSDFSVGDEMFVQCWTGTEWTSVWLAGRVFSPDPATILITPTNRDNLLVTQDAFQHKDGVIPVPDEAKPGVYRITAEIIFRNDPGRPDIESHEAFLIVTE